ncbi:hypothetical protein A1Q2_04682 [Trichosporon asahii var. asahii CBS 8904]|uniref:Uncharacterized protein n=1 Tax=Trichosporon asahii var. asahii (strain CBS 8904) TaxID=1220162 RepID=K1VAD6_TRIAC|nr:hypothetical protein A1Q2_04682 [Trichosporon asahii var. asahii CBS 8904]
MSKVAAFDDEPTFYDCETHVPAAPPGHIAMQSLEIMALVGKATIADLGDGRYAIVLLNMHRGAIKHDPLLAQDRSELQLTADAANQRRMGAYMSYILANGCSNDRSFMERMYEVGEDAVPTDMHAELKRLRTIVVGREAVIHSLRARTAMAKGAVMGERVGKGTEEGRERYETRLAAWREENPATRLSNAMAPDEALLSLATEADYVPLDVVVVHCPACGVYVSGADSFGKYKILHACPSRVSSTTATSTRAVYTRKGLSETVMNWASQAILYPCFADQVKPLGLFEMITEELLLHNDTSVYLAAWGWKRLIPSDLERLSLPHTFVEASSSEEWGIANAIGVALAHSPGLPELETQKIPMGKDSLRKFLAKTTESGKLYRCAKHDCHWVRPYKPRSHDCVSEAGTFFPPEFTKGKGKKRASPGGEPPKGNRHSQSMTELGTFNFHDLPKAIKHRAWASFISASNPLGVDARLFQLARDTFEPVFSPAFGPTEVSERSNKQGPSQRAAQYADKVGAAASAGATS